MTTNRTDTQPSALTRIAKIVVIVAFLGLAGYLVVWTATYLGERVGNAIGADESRVPAGQEVEVAIPPGSTASDIASVLAANNLVGSAAEFQSAVGNRGIGNQLRAGRYTLVTGMSVEELIDTFLAGPNQGAGDVYRITIREGLTTRRTIRRLANESDIPVERFRDALTSGAVTTSLRDMPDKPNLRHWEGLLFPDTYEFESSATAAQILQLMADTMVQRMDSVDWAELEDRDLSPYDGIKIASLIEKEVRVAPERQTVSSVIENRLAEDMPLQIDAAILYAVGSDDPAEFNNEVDSPYNLHMNKGLPPTPIAAPGLASLEAAAHPEDTDYLFYVLSDEDGSHTFSTNLDDHNAAVAEARANDLIP
ncbi:MAG: endolytic transglycosylase MltG [Acidimicrobiia bacterium]|nr:endolytic transglycosylase MltG [Acidimicrobiia bacterium]